MIVGVGASPRARPVRPGQEGGPGDHLHRRARRHRPRPRRRRSAIGGHDEREQTLNQILTEMDGFTGTEGVIVLAATNRPEILDPALLRPGRFDRRVAVNPPDQTGRAAILEVHTRGVPLDRRRVDLAALAAASTPGMVGADLRNLVNEAALLAAAARATSSVAARRLHRRARDASSSAPNATSCSRPRSASAPPTTSRATRCWACCIPAPTRCARSRSSPAAGRSASPSRRRDSDRYGYDAAYLRGRIIGALGRTRGGGAGLRRRDHRRRVRPRAGDQHRPPDGGPLGHVRGDRARSACCPTRGTSGRCSPAPAAAVRGDPRADRRRGPPHRRRVPRTGAVDPRGEPRPARARSPNALLEQETLDEHDAYRAAGIAHEPDAVPVNPAPTTG